MEKQRIISISREYGSGGHLIAEELAKRFGLPLYDDNLLTKIAEKNLIPESYLKLFDEKPKTGILSRTIRGLSSSPEEELAQMQFSYLRGLADEGKSFVVVGRCSEEVLGGYPGEVSFFIYADDSFKTEMVCRKLDVGTEDAEKLVRQINWNRRSYHNFYCKKKWGEASAYDLCINSGVLGVEGTADFLESFLRKKESAKNGQ